TNTLWPAPMSHAPPVQVKNWVLIASGGVVPGPVPGSGAGCGLPGGVSVAGSAADRGPVALGGEVSDMVQPAAGARVRPEQPSPTTVKSSVLGTAALLMNSGASPLLATVTDCAALVVPMACAAKVSDAGVNVTAAAAPAGAAGTPSVSREIATTGSNRKSRILGPLVPRAPLLALRSNCCYITPLAREETGPSITALPEHLAQTSPLAHGHCLT